MSIADDQRIVRQANEQRRVRTWAKKWTDLAWLQQRVTELERWHVNQCSWHIDDDDPDHLRICRGEHGLEDSCEWEIYEREES